MKQSNDGSLSIPRSGEETSIESRRAPMRVIPQAYSENCEKLLSLRLYC